MLEMRYIEKYDGWKFVKFEVGEPSDWECHLFGTGEHGLKLIPTMGNVPNVFWRWMQYTCFGNRWVKRKNG
jgi:hypothetical protein